MEIKYTLVVLFPPQKMLKISYSHGIDFHGTENWFAISFLFHVIQKQQVFFITLPKVSIIFHRNQSYAPFDAWSIRYFVYAYALKDNTK